MFLKCGAFICAKSLQLAAAWLLVGNTSVTRDGIIKSYCAQSRGGISFDKRGQLLNRWALEATVKTSWINLIAFYFLGFGYLLDVFGEWAGDRWIAFVIVLAVTVALVVVPHTYAKHKASKFQSPSLSEIPMEGGVQINIVDDQEYTKEDILN